MDKVYVLLKGINPFVFLAAVLMYITSVYVSTLRWRLLLLEGFRPGKLFPLCLIGSFFSTFLPGLVGGDAVKAYYLYKETGKMGQTIASVFMDRYIGYVALLTIGLLAFPFGFPYFKGSWLEWTVPLIALVFLLGSVVVFGLRLGSRFRPVKEIYDYFKVYKGKKRLIYKAFGFSLIVQLIIMGSVYVLALGLGLGISPLVFLMFCPIITSVSMLPVSISGIGLREASFVLLLGFVGIAPDTATALSFAWFLSIAAGGLPGLVLYVRYKGGRIQG